MFWKNVLLFSNPVWSGSNTVPTTIIRNITDLSSQVAYEARIADNITTLTTTNAETLDGTIQGLLYVPDVTFVASCNEEQYDFIPRNVTRQSNLPPTNYNLIALAPWFSIDCTQAYLASARLDPIRALIFYKPNNSTNQPQDADSPVWNLDDDGAWKKDNKFPIFAVPGLDGQRIMTQLSLYSGNVSEIPHGDDITELYGPNPNDYVRIWTELTMKNPSSVLALWVFFLIIIGALLLIIASVSLTMHFIQRRRRNSLRRRVESGEVDLEAMGVKRLTVPEAHVKDFPLFTYNSEPEIMSVPSTPVSAGGPMSPRSVRSSRKSRRLDQRSVVSVVSTGSIRSKRSSLAGSDTTATNHQPNCHICLVKFEHRLTVIRELPCGHIFHPHCIDEFLTRNSSLCPMCKHCMLPRGFSPKITNGMVRRERAVRRLRERVYLDDSSAESGQTKIRLWGKRLFGSFTTSSPSVVRLTPLRAASSRRDPSRSSGTLAEEADDSITAAGATGPPDTQGSGGAGAENQDSATQASQPTPPTAKKPRPRKTRPRALQLLPTQPEDGELKTTANGRKSPSSFARERMRALAAKNAPFDDPDQQRPKCEWFMSRPRRETLNGSWYNADLY